MKRKDLIKRKVSFTLSGYQLSVFNKAVAVLAENTKEKERLNEQLLIYWAITAVSAAILKYPGLPVPLAVKLQHEDERDTKERLEMDYGDPKMPDGPWTGCRWLLPPQF
jgi:hypothetical protein